MAEALARSFLADRDWHLSSAGFFADQPVPPVPEVEALLLHHGLQTEGLSSKRIDRRQVRAATHIFAMTEMHLATLRKQFPKTRAKAHLVTEFSSLPEFRGKDVPDPIGGETEAFEETFRILNDAIPRIIAYMDGDR